MTAVSVELHVMSDVEVPVAASVAALSRLIRYVLEHEGAGGEWNIGIQFTSDEEIQRLHRDFMGIDSPTDIMTFPYNGSDEAFPGVIEDMTGGDLIISVDHARANAELAGWTTENELLFLVTHGMLHLLGWNDHTDAERDAMLSR
ncbi:MAG: rRNA maturation RNase YbeY, partial [Chloroflexota bacterium]|nr:rRNA maturation RNase YbeY [Chloroflexota bacterium]